jgi:hypothetical protein
MQIDGVILVPGGIQVNSGGTLGGTANLAAALLVADNGRVSPGNSAGTLTVESATFAGTDSELFIEIGGTGPGSEHDQLVVTATASLGGQLLISLDGFIPGNTDTFVIVTAGTLSGGFANVESGRVETLDGMGSFLLTVDIANAEVVLSDFEATAPILGGDYNEDGTVNAADYVVWRNHSGQMFVLAGEDPSAQSPGLVDQEDYDYWRENFGNSQPIDSGGHGAEFTGTADVTSESRNGTTVRSAAVNASPSAELQSKMELLDVPPISIVADPQDSKEAPVEERRTTTLASLARDRALLAWLAAHQVATDPDSLDALASELDDNSTALNPSDLSCDPLDLVLTSWP